MIELREFMSSDFDKIIHWIDNPKSLIEWSGVKFSFPLTKSQLEGFLNESQSAPSIQIHCAVEAETNEMVGLIALSDIDKENRSARLGKILIHKEKRNKGLGKMMIEEALNIAFNDLKLHRVSLGVFEHNKVAISCYEKVGFVLEGILRDERKFGNEYWNLCEMSILEDEYRCKR